MAGNHEDFEIINQSLTTKEVVEHFGFVPNYKGFIKCPFHGGGAERTPSMKIYNHNKGFHCKACGVGGDTVRFVELYMGLSSLCAVKYLSDKFNIPISTNSDVPLEHIKRAKQARLEQQQELISLQEKQLKLRLLSTSIHMYKQLANNLPLFSDSWCYCQVKIPLLIGEWEELFNTMKKG